MRMAPGVQCGRKRDNFGAELSRIGCLLRRGCGGVARKVRRVLKKLALIWL